jgi:hypothetical protein
LDLIHHACSGFCVSLPLRIYHWPCGLSYQKRRAGTKETGLLDHAFDLTVQLLEIRVVQGVVMHWIGLVFIFLAEVAFFIGCSRWDLGWSPWESDRRTRFPDDVTRIGAVVAGFAAIGVGISFFIRDRSPVSWDGMNWYGMLIIIAGVLTFIFLYIDWKNLYEGSLQNEQEDVKGLRDYSGFYAKFDRVHRIYIKILGAGLIVAGVLVLAGVID